MESIVNLIIANETILVALLYLTLTALYLLVIPVLVYFYLNVRWYTAGSFERGFMYFLMFFFFPGVLLLSPIINLRPERRNVKA